MRGLVLLALVPAVAVIARPEVADDLARPQAGLPIFVRPSKVAALAAAADPAPAPAIPAPPPAAAAPAAAAAAAAPAVPLLPPMPRAWPPTDEAQPISGELLNDPLVTASLAYVESVVSPQYLNIPPSKYTSPCVAVYPPETAAQNCYWPANQCVRQNDTAAFQADVYDCPTANTWGVTYDDGPTVNLVNGVNTNDSPALRAKLATMGIKATFFVVGANVVQHPEEVLAEYTDGHQIALHTYTHYPLTSLTNAQVVAELKYNEAAVYNATGALPTFLRPPCGDVDDRIRAIASALGYRIALWTTSPVRDTGDADIVNPTPASAAQVLNTVTSTWFQPQPGFISLQHDIDPFTSGIGLAVLDAVNKTANFPLTMQPVGTCMKLPFYKTIAQIGSISAIKASGDGAARASTAAAAAAAADSTTSAGEMSASRASALFGVLMGALAYGLAL
ncbi:chitin deacetylase [Geranomyces variabilis]|nr:chitin deacetylase [Geranomyces variabilis]